MQIEYLCVMEEMMINEELDYVPSEYLGNVDYPSFLNIEYNKITLDLLKSMKNIGEVAFYRNR